MWCNLMSTFYTVLLLLFTFLWSSNFVLAQPATLPLKDCFSGNATEKLNVSTVYAQILSNASSGKYMNLTVLGQSPQNLLGFSNASTNLATLFTATTVLTFNVFTNSSYLCSTLRPPSPLPPLNNQTTYCPLSAGPFGLSTTIPWNANHELTTLTTRLRAVDPFSNELFCIDVETTPLDPGPVSSIYGRAAIIFWLSVALAIAYWLLVGIARVVSAWGRGRPGSGIWYRVENAGFILASAISGERLSTSPALLRFCTPSMRDIIFHTQWCAALAMVAVQWPSFVYPLLAQTAWTTLSYNLTVTQGSNSRSDRWNPLSVLPYNPPSNFADQLNDPNSVLFVDSNVTNVLFSLPENATSGLESFAYTVGLRPQDLFGVCMALFLSIIAGVIVVSLFIWGIDWFVSLVVGAVGGPSQVSTFGNARSPRYSSASKDMLDAPSPGLPLSEDSRSSPGHYMFRISSRLPFSSRSWWKFRHDISSFHANVLHGNLVRILVLFHFPVTIFSCYQMSLGRSQATLASIVLAALSFSVFSVLLPIGIVIRLTTTSTNKLYDETRTLLFLGPLYNHYRHGSQLFASLLFATNLAFGITIGFGQKSGTAQAIIILVIEVISALVTSVWLPWGVGASMGLISFLFCVARIIIAVLLVILTPTISIGDGAGAWVAYGILVILALVYLAFLLLLLVKLIEALVRIFGGVDFDRSRHVVDSGLLGACGLLGCCSPRKRRPNRRHRVRSSQTPLNPTLTANNVEYPQKVSTPTYSTHSGPPSVLRPEHALRPYREESDDESGYIMGAWQPFPRPGYSAVNNQPPGGQLSADAPTNGGSGFSRVGGGRAHYESPYAIASGSTLTFPSVERGSTHAAPSGMQGSVLVEDDEWPTTSDANVARYPTSNLPPGAMAPSHIRTKSQTAIIEDASTLKNLMGASGPMVGQSSLSPAEDEESDSAQPKKKHWYQLRRNRRNSEGDALSHGDEGASPPAEGGTGGRTFVVIRKTAPSRPGTESGPSAESGPSTGPDAGSPRVRPQSFVVLRDKPKS